MRICLLLVLALAASAASAQGYPSKPVRLVLGFAPGGAADIISRAISDPLGRSLGQPVVVENRPGAGSSLAVGMVAKTPADGYTLLIASQSGMIINPIINKNVGYDVDRDFIAVTQITRSPLVVAVHPSLASRSIRDLIGEAKKTAGKLNYATSGNGSLPHLGAMVFSGIAGVEMVHVPYKSGGDAVTSVVAGTTQLTFATAPSVLPHVKSGRLRGLAVSTKAASPLVPGLPGMEEAGLPGYDVSIWYGFFLPAGTPRDTVMRLFSATGQALQHPPFMQAMARDGTETPASRSPEEFSAFVRDEARLVAKVIRDSGAKFD